jgi:hypothetical protein
MSKASSRATTRTTLELELSHADLIQMLRDAGLVPSSAETLRVCKRSPGSHGQEWGRLRFGEKLVLGFERLCAGQPVIIENSQTLRLEVDQTPSPTS